MGHRSKYPEELRREAVRLVLTTDRPAAWVAADLGISDKTLGNWIRAERERAKPSALSEDERPELKRLRKEDAEPKVEREILRKAVAYLPNGTTR